MELSTTSRRGGEAAGGGEDEQPRASIAIFDPTPGSEVPANQAKLESGGADQEEAGAEDESWLGGWNYRIMHAWVV